MEKHVIYVPAYIQEPTNEFRMFIKFGETKETLQRKFTLRSTQAGVDSSYDWQDVPIIRETFEEYKKRTERK